ncbi:MAG: hypothetical protein KKD39_06040 [Candidatus Altiarchaeota archaeon]|nr:hypothetical protein [Candidatus Altiarchaeota archaeon]
MNGKTKLLGAGLAALLVIGLVTAANAASEGIGKCGGGFLPPKQGYGMMHGKNTGMLLEDLGLPDDATREQVMDALWEKRLVDLGLTGDSTVSELHAAMKAKMQEKKAEMEEKRQERLAELGLTEDATPEEVMAAMKAKCQENGDDCPHKAFGKGGFKGMGFGHYLN